MARDPFFFADRAFWRKIATIALPVGLQNLISTSLNLTDNLMVGQLGEKAIGALSLANQISFLVVLFTFGISSGAAVFASQYWGARDLAGVRRTQGLSSSLAVASALAFTVACLAAPEFLMSLYTPDPDIQRLGAEYLRISALGYPLLALSMSFAMILRSVGRIRLPLVMSIVALALNIALNYGLIFGLWGLPALGVAGSALGTCIARLVEAAGLVGLGYLTRSPNAAHPRQLFHFPKGFLATYLKTALPVVGNEMGWSLGVTTLMGIYAHMGSAALAAVTISDTVLQFVNILLFGTVNATAIVIGNTVGAGRRVRARVEARRMARFAVLAGLAGGLALFAAAPFLPRLFNVGPAARQSAADLLRIWALVFPFRSFLYHMTVGVFRGAGDTRTALYLEVGGLWLLAVPLGLAGSLLLHWPLWAVTALVGLQDVVVSLLAAARYRTGRWYKPIVQR